MTTDDRTIGSASLLTANCWHPLAGHDGDRYRDDERQREYQREYGRLRRTGAAQTPNQTVVPVTFRLKKAADVLALIEEQVGAVRGDDSLTTVERARTVGYLAGVALRAIEAGDLAARVEAVEAVLKSRRAGQVKADGIAKLYDTLSVDERFRLRLQAFARRDMVDCERLDRTCSPFDFRE